MAIDPGVFDRVKSPAPIDPTAVLKEVATTQGALQQAQDESATRQVLQQYGGDISQTTQALRARGLYSAADAIETADTTRRKARAEAIKGELENQNTVNSRVSGYLESARNGLTPENAPERLGVLRRQLAGTPAGPDDPQGLHDQLLSQLNQYDPEKTPALLEQWSNGLISEQEQVKQQQETLKALYGDDPIKGAAQLLSQTTDPQDYAQEYAAVLGSVHSPDARRLIAQTFPAPESITNPEAFAAVQAKAKALTTTQSEKDTAANQAALRAQAAASLAETHRHNVADEGVSRQNAATAATRASQDSAQANDDAQQIAQGIMNGDQPPDLARLYGKGAAVRAELERHGYNLTKATQDWTATQKYLSTLNGAQQTRLRQAVAFTTESLPIVRGLVTEWDSAGLPLLSKANLDAAASGAYGPTQQSLAVRLRGQIADLTSELGTVYKGGNSSTDESLKLAAQNLSGNWSKQAALDALAQIEQNLTIRKNSMISAGVAGVTNNAYAPAGAEATGGATVKVTRGPDGRLTVTR
jgi:hypothetical protein